MRQSRTYFRAKKGGVNIDPNAYDTYRTAMAYRIIRKRHGLIHRKDAWDLAAVPAFFLWIFRKPINFFKKKKVARRIQHKLDKSNSNRPADK